MADIAFLDAYVAISQTKAQYCRALDGKQWDDYGDVFTEDVVLDTTGAGGGVYHGRAETVRLVRASIEHASTAHQVHSPEIVLESDTVANVIWAMQDRVVYGEDRRHILGNAGHTGYGQYHERYVKEADGKWRIAHQRLTRFHVDTHPL